MSQEIIDNMEQFFKSIKGEFKEMPMTARALSPDINLYNDADVVESPEERDLNEVVFDYEKFILEKTKELKGFEKKVDLAGVDTSTIQLGITETGIVSAIKSCIVTKIDDKYSLETFGPQIFVINKDDRKAIFEYVMKAMGFSDNQIQNKKIPDFSVLQDRVRNWLEKETQRIAIGRIKDGIVLFDGTLIGETHDTTETYNKQTLQLAQNQSNKNHVVAISKKTRLVTKDGRTVIDLLSDKIKTCYLNIKNIIDTQREVSLGEIFVCKFSIDGYSFRVDTYPYLESHENLLNIFFSNSVFRLGYPDVLRYAHIFSYFTAKEVLELQVLASVKYGLKIKNSYNVHPALFGPYRYKGV